MPTTQQFVGKLQLCLIVIATCIYCTENLSAQQPTVGLLQFSQENQQSGYVLFAPLFSTTTYLIDKCGNQVHSWESEYKPGLSVYLLPDGSILRAGNVNNPLFALGGGAGGVIEKIGWDGTLLWSYRISDQTQCQHHDIKPMPNGNVLAIVWEAKTYQESIDAGRDSTKTAQIGWYEKIIEIEPTGLTTGNIVWQWSVWDHLVQDYDQESSNYGNVAEAPERINMNYISSANPNSSEWIHSNSIDYNPELDQIMISAYNFDEVWIIDHSTTTAVSASHSGGKYGKGGDLLYRWGNPNAYNRGTETDKKLFGQHSAQWIPKGLLDGGKIMVFNNGSRGSANFSSIDVIAPPIDKSDNYILEKDKPFAPVELSWTYTDSMPSSFFASNYSGAQRLSNGNMLICSGPTGLFCEVTPNNKKVWQYKNPVSIMGTAKQGSSVSGNSVFRAVLYPPDFPGFVGRDISQGTPIELEPYSSLCSTSTVDNPDTQQNSIEIYPNPTNQRVYVKLGNDSQFITKLSLVNILGQEFTREFIRLGLDSYSIDVHDIPTGIYTLRIFNGTSLNVNSVLITR